MLIQTDTVQWEARKGRDDQYILQVVHRNELVSSSYHASNAQAARGDYLSCPLHAQGTHGGLPRRSQVLSTSCVEDGKNGTCMGKPTCKFAQKDVKHR
jgi:hypothetical protein